MELKYFMLGEMGIELRFFDSKDSTLESSILR